MTVTHGEAPTVVGNADNTATEHLFAVSHDSSCSLDELAKDFKEGRIERLLEFNDFDSETAFVLAATSAINTFDDDKVEADYPCVELVPVAHVPMTKKPKSLKRSSDVFEQLRENALASAVAQAAIAKAMDAVDQQSLRDFDETLSLDFFSRHRMAADGFRAADWARDMFASFGLPTAEESFDPALFPNIVATLAGTTRADELVVIGAHLDSRMQDLNDPLSRAPGADDNGSGSAGVLEIARVLTTENIRFERTIVFALWGAEEGGLVGSRAWAKNARDTNLDVTAYLNFDMMGFTLPGEPITLGIRERFTDPDLFNFVNATTQDYTDLPIGLSGGCCSDYQSFFEQDYPAMALFENPMTVCVATPLPPPPDRMMCTPRVLPRILYVTFHHPLRGHCYDSFSRSHACHSEPRPPSTTQTSLRLHLQ
jgi:hypothetical protein